jgi:putative spermidine/putrescine transport system ATP-binding protein
MRSELKKLQRELGITFIHVTHGQDEALALADEIVVMNNAVIEQSGPARDVFDAPRTEFVARFIGSHNVIALAQGHVAVRSDRIGLTDPTTARLRGHVTTIEYQGTSVTLNIHADGDQDIAAVMPDDRFFADPLSEGAAVGLTWDDAAMHRLGA